MSNDARWYVIHTYSGYENKVAATIEKAVENRKMQDLILEISVPTEKVIEIKDTGTKEVERKIFPSYVLVKMVLTDESWYVVRNTRGVTSFVGPGSKPVPLTEAEVASMGVERKEITVNYNVGDTVKVLTGPFENFVGRVDEIDLAQGVVKVTVSMFGRETPVELKLDQVELVS